MITKKSCCASNPPLSQHLFAINEPCHSDHRCRRIEGTKRSSIKSIKVPSITPYEKILSQSRVWRSAKRFSHRELPLRGDLPLISSSRASFAPVPAKQGMEICFWIVIIGDLRSVRRPDSSVESGLGFLLSYCRIEKRNPAYGDSFFCRPASEAEPGFMTDGHIRVRRGRRHDQGRESRLPRRFAPQRRLHPSSRASFAWRSAFIFVDYQNCRLPRPLHKCVLASSTVSGLAVTDQQSSRASVLIMLVIMILIITIKEFLLIKLLTH